MSGNWGHTSRHCKYCGKVGPRVQVFGGFAHRRCIPKGSADDHASKVRPLSKNAVDALFFMKDATRAKPELPRRYLFKRRWADYCVDRGLANYRSFSKEEGAGGYWLTAAGRAVLARPLTTKQQGS